MAGIANEAPVTAKEGSTVPGQAPPSDPTAFVTGFGTLPLPARVETEDGRQHFALLSSGPSGSFRLIVGGILLGRKVRMILLQSDKGELLVGTARVLRTLRLSEGLYENEAIILNLGQRTE